MGNGAHIATFFRINSSPLPAKETPPLKRSPGSTVNHVTANKTTKQKNNKKENPALGAGFFFCLDCLFLG